MTLFPCERKFEEKQICKWWDPLLIKQLGASRQLLKEIRSKQTKGSKDHFLNRAIQNLVHMTEKLSIQNQLISFIFSLSLNHNCLSIAKSKTSVLKICTLFFALSLENKLLFFFTLCVCVCVCVCMCVRACVSAHACRHVCVHARVLCFLLLLLLFSRMLSVRFVFLINLKQRSLQAF